MNVDNGSYVVAVADDGNGPIFKLPRAIVHLIFDFVRDYPNAAAASTRFVWMVEAANQRSLQNTTRRIHQRTSFATCFRWQQSMRSLAGGIYDDYYSRERPPSPYFPSFACPQRLLARLATSAPISTFRVEITGIATALPKGDIAIFNTLGWFHFFNVATNAFYRQERAGVGSALPAYAYRKIDTLYYTSGFLVVRRGEGVLGQLPLSYTVWRADDLSFIRDIVPLWPHTRASVVDEPNGKVLSVLLREIDQSTFCLDMVSTDIETGAESLVSIPTRFSNEFQDDAVFAVGACGDNVIVSVYTSENERFPKSGLGFHVINRNHERPAFKYFPCFQESETMILNNQYFQRPLKSTWKRVGFYYGPRACDYDSPASVQFGAAVFNENDATAEAPVFHYGMTMEKPQFGTSRVLLVTDTRMFVYGENATRRIEIDEVDIETGKQVRSFRTGIQGDFKNRNGSVSVGVTETFLFCLFCPVGAESTLLTFLLQE